MEQHMTRLIIIDISNVYAQIYDELFCTDDDVERIKAQYKFPDYAVVKVTY